MNLNASSTTHRIRTIAWGAVAVMIALAVCLWLYYGSAEMDSKAPFGSEIGAPHASSSSLDDVQTVVSPVPNEGGQDRPRPVAGEQTPPLNAWLQGRAEQGQWSAEKKFLHSISWRRVCLMEGSQAIMAARLGETEETSETLARRARRLCEDSADEGESPTNPDADDLEAFLASHGNPGEWLIYSTPKVLTDALDDFGAPAALDEAAGLLDRAIRDRDEMQVASAIHFLLEHRLIAPPFPDAQYDTSEHYRGIIGEVAVQLICDQPGMRCADPMHPFVFRQCMARIQQRIICHRPVGLADAIHQTLTPIQHRAFLALLDQVRRLRSRGS